VAMPSAISTGRDNDVLRIDVRCTGGLQVELPFLPPVLTVSSSCSARAVLPCDGNTLERIPNGGVAIEITGITRAPPIANNTFLLTVMIILLLEVVLGRRDRASPTRCRFGRSLPRATRTS
jgi:hypothetical protein